MIETLSFEIDEVIYSTLKAELSVETPFFKGKLSPKLPRLINQWVSEKERSDGRLKRDGDRNGHLSATTGRAVPAARIPRLINPWPVDTNTSRGSENGRVTVRRHERISCMMLIEYEVSSRIYIDFVRNVSRNGAYLETRKGMEIGGSVILMIPLRKDRLIIRVKGMIVRKDQAGVGIEFKEILSP